MNHASKIKSGLTVILILSAIGLQASCTYTAAVSLTNIPAQRQAPITATVEKMVFLGLNFDNENVFQLSSKLRSQCEGGQVKGILTKDMRTYYFFAFVMSQKTTASGYCVRRGSKTADGFEQHPEQAGLMASAPGDASDPKIDSGESDAESSEDDTIEVAL
ncbi:MAG: hypothetical protein H7318_19435 [Oligoflexus sp.]|nr:hypothetical protein [Oligoflexus sp.]